MLHTLHAKENGAKIMVVDPRFTRTAAKADKYYRIRSGTDVAFLIGLLHHIFKNGWEDKEYIHDARLRHGQGARRSGEVDAGGSRARHRHERSRSVRRRRTMAKNRPSTIVWAMGQTQHTNGNAIVRASCIVQLALGNIGVPAAARTSTAATTTCRARPTSGPIPIRCRAITASPRARGSTSRRCGASTTSGSSSSSPTRR